jgi:hypothetical protein
VKRLKRDTNQKENSDLFLLGAITVERRAEYQSRGGEETERIET